LRRRKAWTESGSGQHPHSRSSNRFENDAKEIERIDLELATREYRSQGLAAKAQAGFRLYAQHHDMDRLRRVMDQQEITARIFAL